MKIAKTGWTFKNYCSLKNALNLTHDLNCSNCRQASFWLIKSLFLNIESRLNQWTESTQLIILNFRDDMIDSHKI